MERQDGRGARPRGVARRRFLTAIPAAVAGSIAAPALARQQPTPPRIDPRRSTARRRSSASTSPRPRSSRPPPGVSRNLTSFEQLRELNIPLDTEPAVTFRPYLPGKKPKGAPPRREDQGHAADRRRPVGVALDDLAFLPITSLAPLLQRRDVSATDLTKMYLSGSRSTDRSSIASSR